MVARSLDASVEASDAAAVLRRRASLKLAVDAHLCGLVDVAPHLQAPLAQLVCLQLPSCPSLGVCALIVLGHGHSASAMLHATLLVHLCRGQAAIHSRASMLFMPRLPAVNSLAVAAGAYRLCSRWPHGFGSTRTVDHFCPCSARGHTAQAVRCVCGHARGFPRAG